VVFVNRARNREELAEAELRQRRWLGENEPAIASSNDYVERYGLPLAAFRPF
jgi:antitoxin CcdA